MKFSTFILLLVLLTTSFRTSAQQLKTYTGPYKINNIEGTANYTYKDASDGTRIFHGNFSFRAENNKYRAQGNFKDNVQVGKWNWTGPWFLNFYNDDTNPVQEFSFTFNEEGVLDGPASYARGQYDQYHLTIKDDRIIGQVPFISGHSEDNVLVATWENGHLVGDYKHVETTRNRHDDSTSQYVTVGEFNSKGDPIGLWTLKGDDGIIVYTKYTDSGKLIESYYFEPSTGDRIESNMTYYPVLFTPALFRNRKQFLLRDSKNVSNSPKAKPKEIIYEAVEESAQFPGGMGALMKYISNNLQYPMEAAKNGIQGRVIVKILVKSDGTIGNAIIMKGVEESLNEEALRIAKNLPSWIPAKNNGQTVSSYFNLPITFKLDTQE